MQMGPDTVLNPYSWHGHNRSSFHRSKGFKSMPNHLFRLLEQHQKLDAEIIRVQSYRISDPFEIARLRKLKLSIKDRLMKLSHKPVSQH